MKRLVNLVQLLIIVIIVYPVYYVWDTGRVDDLCAQIKPGMTKSSFLQLVDDFNVKLVGPEDEGEAGGIWHASVIARASLSSPGYACEVKGTGDLVAVARLNQQ